MLVSLYASWITVGYAQQNETAVKQSEAGEAPVQNDAPAAVTLEEAAEPAAQDEASEAVTQDAASDAARQEEVTEYLRKAQEAFDIADVIGAMSLYRKAAELGDAAAQTRLGYLLDQAEQNQEAAEWLEKAVAQGHGEAEFYLAKLYSAHGELKQDFPRAAELLESAARRGYTPAIRVLAKAYETGDLELIRNYDKAVAWLRAGVEAGDVSSMERLRQAYRNGDLGLRIDTDKARELESLIAQQRAQTE